MTQKLDVPARPGIRIRAGRLGVLDCRDMRRRYRDRRGRNPGRLLGFTRLREGPERLERMPDCKCHGLLQRKFNSPPPQVLPARPPSPASLSKSRLSSLPPPLRGKPKPHGAHAVRGLAAKKPLPPAGHL